VGEFRAESDVRDRNVIEDQVESPCSLHQVVPDQSRYLNVRIAYQHPDNPV
jgi:hypothetical protein